MFYREKEIYLKSCIYAPMIFLVMKKGQASTIKIENEVSITWRYNCHIGKMTFTKILNVRQKECCHLFDHS